jgi:hypothetical protein
MSGPWTMGDDYTGTMPERALELRVVCVEWVDSNRTDGWIDACNVEQIAEEEDVLPVVSYGFLVAESVDRVVISTSVHATGAALSPLAIPRRAILRLRDAEVALTS